MTEPLPPPSKLLRFGRPLRAHQVEDLDRFAGDEYLALNGPSAALLWEMGLGKTTEAIAILRAAYFRHRRVMRTLIISPVATLYNWKDEWELNSPEQVREQVLVPYMKTKKTKLKGAERAALIDMSGKAIVIVNPESLDQDVMLGAFAKFRPECLVIDEAHYFKNYKSKRLKSLLAIADRAYLRLIMTGTPILNSYLDLWALWRILDGGQTFGTNFFSFRDRYFYDKNAGFRGKPTYFPDWQPRAGIGPEISRLMSIRSSRRIKSETLDLPEQVFTTRHVELSPEQRRAYEDMEATLVAEIREGTCAAANALTRVGRMLQIVSGYLPVEQEEGDHVAVPFKENPRLAALAELLEELTPSHKVIVWCAYTENYRIVSRFCEEAKLQYATLIGGQKDVQGEIERFQNDPDCRVMIANAQAGGAGINLTSASYSIYFSRTYSLGQRLQSEARNHRDGSQVHEKITVIDLVARETIDEEVLKALQRKEAFSDQVLKRIQEIYGSEKRKEKPHASA